jgi:ABC-type transport system involved in cytochrome bd biosynthesis fused ATPase/permease subunit
MVVVGPVGSGKSTLLHSIMNETRHCSGEKTIKGTIAYVEQEPFIISGSIKENILFGKVFNDQLFN